ncbi:MAG TPA: isoprenylcysteine carboxylmethyltransferase family protein [Myxococcales bacterium]|jgi:methyltransferase|nr:isoprenylcysteine carboxylmethyltransferase family protein [Myxococcales bacterium]
MVIPRAAYLCFVALIGAERLFEMVLSRRNAARAIARGGREYGDAHFPWMVALHTAFLASCAVESAWRRFPGAAGWIALLFAVGAQGLRYWAVSSLGDRWNARVIVVPGEPPVVDGPYRFVRHPNYLAVVIEMVAIPLVYGCWITAVAFSLANAAMLRVRIRIEEAALGVSWQRAFARRSRFLPGGFGSA